MAKKRKTQNDAVMNMLARATGSQITHRNQPIQRTKIEVNKTFIFAGEIHRIDHTISLLNLTEVITTVEGTNKLYPWHPDIVEEIMNNQWKYK